MTQSAKAQEPSMEEILASIRRIIADDDPQKTAAAAASARPAPRPVPAAPVPLRAPPPRPAASSMNQHDVDAMLAGPGHAAEAEPDSEILDLTEAMTAPPPPAPSFKTIDGQPDVIFSEGAAAEPAPENEFPNMAEEARRQYAAHPAAPQPLLSSSTTAAVDSAFNTLAQTVFVQNARTLEDLVREMLRPMLKAWLDDNLPGLVERLVRSEIERVSRGRT